MLPETRPAGSKGFNIADVLTQPPRKRYRLAAMSQADEGTQPATAGVIERMVLKNFMCHDNLEVVLGPQLNFIIGNNGSGKSAILTGLSVGLGAKASNTNRGKSLLNLIKRGRTTSRVTITFANVGHEAYMPHLYGNKISVERVLKKEAAAGYFLKSEGGKTISTKKVDLDAMLLKFGIAIDNPMAFLSQDNARSFITTASDAQKYKYYEIGSRIYQNKADLVETGINNQEMHSKVATLAAAVEDAEACRSQARETYTRFQKGVDLKIEHRRVQAQLSWLEVRTLREKQKELLEKERFLEEDLDKIAQEMAKLESHMQNFDDDKRRAVEATALAHEAVTAQQVVVSNCEEHAQNGRREELSLQGSMEEANQAIARLAQEVATKEKELSAEQQRLDKLNGGSMDTLRERLASYQAERETLILRRNQLQDEHSRLGETHGVPLGEAREATARAREEMATALQKLATLKNAQADPLAMFDPRLRRVLHEIKAERRFQQPPVGPMGLHVTVKEEFKQYARIINEVMHKELDSFLVTNPADEKLLNGILSRHRLNNGVYCRRDEVFDYLGGSSAYSTFLDALSFDNEFVKRTMIDFKNIEKFVLAPDRSAAREILDRPDRNVFLVFTLFDSRSGQRLSKGENGSRRDDPVRYLSGFKMSQRTYSETALGEAEQELAGAQRGAKAAEENQQRVHAERVQAEDRVRSQLRQVTERLKLFDKQIYELENKLSESSDLGKLESLMEGIQEARDQRVIQVNDLSDLSLEYTKVKATRKQWTAKVKEAAGVLASLLQELQERKVAVGLFDTKKSQIVGQQTHYRTGREKREARKAQYQEVAGRLVEEISKLEAAAVHMMPMAECGLNPSDTEEGLARKLGEIVEQVEELENRLGGSFEAAQARLEECEARYSNLKTSFDDFNAIHRRIGDDVMFRTLDLKETIENWTNTINQSFKLSLHQRGFDGELEFDHQKQLLKMKVSKDGSTNFRAVDSLSGGEKSFTQIALLLAIWQPMRAKIRGLDEFDVFMDSVNRKMAMKMMLLTLRKQHKSQTIFITPQDIAEVEGINGPDVHIHRIADPERANASV